MLKLIIFLSMVFNQNVLFKQDSCMTIRLGILLCANPYFYFYFYKVYISAIELIFYSSKGLD